MSEPFLCGVDVGTGSARAGIFSGNGKLLARAAQPITLIRPAAGLAEHDSTDIWQAVCSSVRQALRDSGVKPEQVVALGFDATCSLVCRTKQGDPVAVSPSGPARFDTICWMDHRAISEADAITRTGHRVLDFIGGVMSPEMQTPKLAWLKKHNPEGWAQTGLAFDLADFLTWKATGSLARSQCTLTSKWTYLAHEDGWQHDFLEEIGLADLVERSGLPKAGVLPGEAIGALTATAASELGLGEGTLVAAGLIDAFAGALGSIGACEGEGIDRHLALIAGTSSCVMAIAPEPRPARGLWGPYFGAALPGYWLSEGGQSATGALLDHIISQFGGGLIPDQSTHERITARISVMFDAEGPGLGGALHILPDFHGNRTPYADPAPAGVLSGLALDSTFDGLCRLYWRACVALALGLRDILEHMNAHGYRIDTLHMTGGHARSPLLRALYADAIGCSIAIAEENDAVLLGSAMNAAAAAGLHPNLATSCRAMKGAVRTVQPNPAFRAHYERDFRIFKRLHEHRRELAEF